MNDLHYVICNDERCGHVAVNIEADGTVQILNTFFNHRRIFGGDTREVSLAMAVAYIHNALA